MACSHNQCGDNKVTHMHWGASGCECDEGYNPVKDSNGIVQRCEEKFAGCGPNQHEETKTDANGNTWKECQCNNGYHWNNNFTECLPDSSGCPDLDLMDLDNSACVYKDGTTCYTFAQYSADYKAEFCETATKKKLAYWLAMFNNRVKVDGKIYCPTDLLINASEENRYYYKIPSGWSAADMPARHCSESTVNIFQK
jgi:hypothetical protein